MGSIPLPALDIKTNQTNPLDEYSKVVQLKSLLQAQQQEQQMAPLRLQQAQNTVTQGQQQNTLVQLEIQDKQGLASAMKDVYGAQEQPNQAATPSANGQAPTPEANAAPQSLGTPSADRFSDFLTRIQDPKYGISPQTQLGLMKSITEMQTQAATRTKDELANQEEAQKQIAQHIASVLQAPPEDQPYQYGLEANALKRNPLLASVASKLPPQFPGADQLKQTLQGLMVAGDFNAWTKQQNEAPGQIAESTKKQMDVAKPNPQQISDAASTLSTYKAIPQNMRSGLTAEIQNAPTYEALQKVQARADAANESFQRSADARQQAMALKDVGLQQVVAGKLVAEDQKLGTSLDQTSGIRGLLDMSKGGNQQATAAAQVRFAEHEIVEGGVKRMNQTELNALTSGLGSYGRQFKAWADKGFEGKMPAATNAEMNKILDAEDKVANTTHERNVGYIGNRYGGIAPNAKTTTPTASKANDPLNIR